MIKLNLRVAWMRYKDAYVYAFADEETLMAPDMIEMLFYFSDDDNIRAGRISVQVYANT